MYNLSFFFIGQDDAQPPPAKRQCTDAQVLVTPDQWETIQHLRSLQQGQPAGVMFRRSPTPPSSPEEHREQKPPPQDQEEQIQVGEIPQEVHQWYQEQVLPTAGELGDHPTLESFRKRQYPLHEPPRQCATFFSAGVESPDRNRAWCPTGGEGSFRGQRIGIPETWNQLAVGATGTDWSLPKGITLEKLLWYRHGWAQPGVNQDMEAHFSPPPPPPKQQSDKEQPKKSVEGPPTLIAHRSMRKGDRKVQCFGVDPRLKALVLGDSNLRGLTTLYPVKAAASIRKQVNDHLRQGEGSMHLFEKGTRTGVTALAGANLCDLVALLMQDIRFKLGPTTAPHLPDPVISRAFGSTHPSTMDKPLEILPNNFTRGYEPHSGIESLVLVAGINDLYAALFGTKGKSGSTLSRPDQRLTPKERMKNLTTFWRQICTPPPATKAHTGKPLSLWEQIPRLLCWMFPKADITIIRMVPPAPLWEAEDTTELRDILSHAYGQLATNSSLLQSTLAEEDRKRFHFVALSAPEAWHWQPVKWSKPIWKEFKELEALKACTPARKLELARKGAHLTNANFPPSLKWREDNKITEACPPFLGLEKLRLFIMWALNQPKDRESPRDGYYSKLIHPVKQ